MYNDKLVYKLIIWVFFLISLWKEKEALSPGIFYNNIFGIRLVVR